MKHNQLRVGNKILYKEEILTVDCICTGHVTLKEHATEEEYGQWIDLDEIEFIPLTEKLLIDNCGFELSSATGLYGFFANGFRYCIDLKNNSIHFDYKKYENIYTDIEYLHQLENLYYSLTGQELEAKFEKCPFCSGNNCITETSQSGNKVTFKCKNNVKLTVDNA